MLALKFAFNERGMERVWATILDTNKASFRMHEKCGYKVEGIMRKAVFADGKYHDLTMMSILKEEFEEAYNTYKQKHEV